MNFKITLVFIQNCSVRLQEDNPAFAICTTKQDSSGNPFEIREMSYLKCICFLIPQI